MKWSNLFSRRRLGDPSHSSTRKDPGRSDFERDYDRITYSTAFRRLQGKTQVFPLPESDFIHTRLTHSLETCCVGRSLGKKVGDSVVHNYNAEFRKIGIAPHDFGCIVAAACLAHDIGNPPFGHSGEDAIREYFQRDGEVEFLEDLRRGQKADFQYFDGNPLGFRLLTNTQRSQSRLPGGLQLTHATLGVLMKYPKESLPNDGNSKDASQKKYGFFQAEKRSFAEIAGELGLKSRGSDTYLAWRRHPLAFLVEAADDICYHIVDLEDGFRLGLVGFPKAEELLIDVITSGHGRRRREKIGSDERYRSVRDKREKISILRALSINELVNQTVERFVNEERDILAGTFDQELVKSIPAKGVLEDIKNISQRKIYEHRPVIAIECSGYEILHGLLDTFLKAVLDTSLSPRYRRIRKLIPQQYLANGDRPYRDQYINILNVTQLVSSMTDLWAIKTFREIKGISMPTY